MSKFNTEKNKLEKVWNDSEDNKNKSKEKSNQEKFDFFTNLNKQQNIKVPIKIYDSGDLHAIPYTPADAHTTTKGELMPTIGSYSASVDLEVPEEMLSFVKYSIAVNPIPTAGTHLIHEYVDSTWGGDNIRVEGDGILIYKGAVWGTPNVNKRLTTNTLLAMGVSLSLTKRVWIGTIVPIPPETDRGGTLSRIKTTEILLENSCYRRDEDGNILYDEHGEPIQVESDTNTFEVNHGQNQDHEFTNIVNDYFSGIGNEIITTWTNHENGACVPHFVYNYDVFKTKNFNSVDSYRLTFVLWSSIWESHSYTTILSSQIQSQIFTEDRRWLFFHSDYKVISDLFGTRDTGVDGDFREIELYYPRHMYNTIVLKRNTEEYNTPPMVVRYEDNPSLVTTSRNFKNYVKISESTATIPTYRFNLSGNFIITSPSIVQKTISKSNTNIITQ